jgi:hypothetical protein
MNTCRSILFACLISSSYLFGQTVYTDKGHWVGLTAGYVPSRDNFAFTGMYEYRFERYWSVMVDLTNFNLTNNSALVVGTSLRMRIPIARYNKNIFGQFGLGSGSIYPVLFYALGFEYGIVEKISVFTQFKRYTSNFDKLLSPYTVYSVGLNIDLTPASVRESYLLDK